ncbi:MAG: alcohol dehydrogenase catalytic domain-containing protein [Desulfobacterales bacterium]|jgi:threonine dehydrogenase-like Zn-dependent dehydrogenase
MRAAVLYSISDLRVEEINTSQVGPADILLRVSYCGVCGSDVPRIIKNAAHYYPIILGHEFSGVIADVADGLNSELIGRKSVCAPLMPNFSDPQCARGNYSLSKGYDFIGSNKQGGFAEYVAMPARNAIILDDSLDLLTASFLEPLTVALHAIDIVNYRPGRKAAVIGVGGIGLLLLQCLMRLGALSISAFDIDDNKLVSAKDLGVDFCFNSRDQDIAKKTLESAAPSGYDFVFETAGAPAAEILALKLAAPRGYVVFVGTPHSALTLQPAEFELINRKELTLKGAWLNYSAPFPGWEWDYGIELLAKQQINIEGLIGSMLPLSQADRLPSLLSAMGDSKRKIVLDCSA